MPCDIALLALGDALCFCNLALGDALCFFLAVHLLNCAYKFAYRDVLSLTIGAHNLFVFCSSAPGDQSGEVPWCLFRPLYRLPFGLIFKALIMALGLFVLFLKLIRCIMNNA
ncbi:hypothetical protein PIB30_083397 [Stylosanthes scabra]|uniref:Uncharacterized protein n=1 Tax=Stylosanthes scabra TaxID=79078 RepID=A0ABU6UVZ2_9FABA|nr:hypothetical protein [Stylosanthes scabra]